ncbi:Rv1355c family protein [Mycolicibacterium hodleri]|uniref:Rv1355c family protein n=1 Tax=Mycolicibacterium hodleri TaxID=49897 RepID=A0A502EG74_9MYCO|nr:Rv1355c family protein [Mycolicibacterium hodleri]TPG36733.1 Rv1355c family protein [Mycolicibacterium hodleri]
MTAIDAASDSAAQILDAAVGQDARRLAELQTDPRIEFVDSWAAQSAALNRLGPNVDAEVLEESPRFAYYPWRRAVVKIIGPRSFRRLRLDRNRNLITADEQDRLGRLHVGVIGLSAGHVIAHTLALQGLCGEMRLADYDELDLSNLNRVPAGVFDLGLNKATAAARRIAEVDPYLTVRTFRSGVTADDIDEFLEGLDVVVEECDSIDLKVGIRRSARTHRLPVLMATSDRGLIDVERFDLEPDRPIFHGLLGDVDPETLADLSASDKVPYVLRLIEVGGLSSRAAASLLEVGHAVVTWPQLAGDVTLGAGPVAEAVRRIGLGEDLSSGRIRLDVGAALDRIATPSQAPALVGVDTDRTPAASAESDDLIASMVNAAVRAPSGGNVQPWTIDALPDGVAIALDPDRTSTIDVGRRGSAVALGAAAYNARVAAAAHGAVSQVDFVEAASPCPLTARIRLTEGIDDNLAPSYDAMLRRETNRNRGNGAALPPDVGDRLIETAQREGARLQLITSRADIDEIAGIFAAADRIRYLTARLHEEMISELRWPGDEDPDTGIDVLSLELGPTGDVALEILRRADVMAELAVWDGGTVLGDDTAAGLTASSAVAVLCVPGHDLVDYARGGSAVEATWIAAQELGLAVAPISPPFLYALNDEELVDVSPKHAEELAELRSRFCTVTGTAGNAQEALVLVLRLSIASPSTVRSRRRRVNICSSPLP